MFTPGNILVIEDNPANLKLVSDLLTAQGYGVFQAETAGAGLDILKKEYQKIVLVLLDLKLPDIDGIEVLKKIKQIPNIAEIPVIVISAHAMEADIKAAKQAGCADYITKPINVREFLNKVESIKVIAK